MAASEGNHVGRQVQVVSRSGRVGRRRALRASAFCVSGRPLTVVLMSRNWDDLFRAWAKPFSATEEAKAERAVRLIKDALGAWRPLTRRDFTVYLSGSYRNNTNTRLESDVDVAVVLREAWYSEYPADGSPNEQLLGFGGVDYGLPEFRNDVGAALRAAFGTPAVSVGDKAFCVQENPQRLVADVAVFLEHRRYTGARDSSGAWLYLAGGQMFPRSDPAKRIINWHEQHYAEGVARNEETGGRFKRVTRILKRLRDDMMQTGSSDARNAAKRMASFLVECLVFNAPDDTFSPSAEGYYADVKEVVAELWRATKSDAAACSKYVEVNRLKWLFRTTQPWSRTDAHEFLLRAWRHVGFD